MEGDREIERETDREMNGMYIDEDREKGERERDREIKGKLERNGKNVKSCA